MLSFTARGLSLALASSGTSGGGGGGSAGGSAGPAAAVVEAHKEGEVDDLDGGMDMFGGSARGGDY